MSRNFPKIPAFLVVIIVIALLLVYLPQVAIALIILSIVVWLLKSKGRGVTKSSRRMHYENQTRVFQQPCGQCHGTGQIEDRRPSRSGRPPSGYLSCPSCDGTGVTYVRK